jgi:hypothetical protein
MAKHDLNENMQCLVAHYREDSTTSKMVSQPQCNWCRNGCGWVEHAERELECEGKRKPVPDSWKLVNGVYSFNG